MNVIILSHFQAQTLLEAREKGLGTTLVSLDLGDQPCYGGIGFEGCASHTSSGIELGRAEAIADLPSSCYIIENGAAQPIQFYSEMTDRLYSLYPTSSAPSMLISGIPMHRIKNTDPHQDTLEKIHSIKPVVGRDWILLQAWAIPPFRLPVQPNRSQPLTSTPLFYGYAG